MMTITPTMAEDSHREDRDCEREKGFIHGEADRRKKAGLPEAVGSHQSPDFAALSF
jgi:hypothetical protein